VNAAGVLARPLFFSMMWRRFSIDSVLFHRSLEEVITSCQGPCLFSTSHPSSHLLRSTMKLDHSILVFLFVDLVVGFLPPSMGSSRNRVALSEQEEKRGFFGSISNFFEELDAFVDDATSRRLGAGSAFYGKRKSSFYGKNDKNKKQDRNVPSPTEDYQGM
jgi:hypothetical protein